MAKAKTEKIPYELGEQIHEDSFSVTYRGFFGSARDAKIIRVQKSDAKEASSFYFVNEFELGKLVSDSGILRPEMMVDVAERICLVYENISFGLLEKRLTGNPKIEVAEFLEMALSLSENLFKLHSVGIVHNQVSPKAFFYDPESRVSKLAWLGGASLLLSDKGGYVPQRYTFDLLAYCSPENTGRLNRAVDSRSDAYSLGALFYQILVGVPPFNSDDPLELIHYHIARSPVSLTKLRDDIPRAVSDVIDKLLSKMPEERYRSLESLNHDLKNIKESLRSRRKLSEFLPGIYEQRTGFRDSDRVYDREKERKTIEAAIVGVTSGKRGVVVVRGKSGTGKTTLVEDAISYLDIYSVQLIRGKFEEDKRGIPYFAFRQMMGDLLRTILERKEEEIIRLRNYIKETLGENFEILLHFLPDLVNLLGVNDKTKDRKKARDEKTLFAVVLRFLCLCFDKKNPAVILMDDVQWADPASVSLIEFILQSEEWEGLLFVLASRIEEGEFASLKGKELASGLEVREITLGPLSRESVRKYVTDSLYIDANDADKLVEILISKTDGNPLFLHQFLKSLFQDSCLTFNQTTSRYVPEWDRILQRGVTENVLDLVFERIARLPEETALVLRVGACIGAKFDLRILYDFFKDTPDSLSRGIRESVKEGILFYRESGTMLFPALQYIAQGKIEESGLLSSLSEVQFRFSHDRMSQGISDATEPIERGKIHKRLARILIEREKESGNGALVLEIASHLVRSQELREDEEGSEDFFHYTVLAGNAAKAAAAYESAYSIFRLISSLLRKNHWRSDRKTSFNIMKSLAESAYYLSKREEAEEIVTELLGKAESPIEKVDVYLMQLEVMNVFNDLESAYKIGVDALECLGIRFRGKPGVVGLLFEFLKMIVYGRGRSPEKLINAKENKNPHKVEAVNIIVNLLNYGKHMDATVMAYLYLKLINLTLKEGNSPPSFFGYAGFGSVILAGTGNFELSLRYWRLAEGILERFEADHLYGRYIFGRTILLDYFKHPFRAIVDFAEESYHKCLQHGDYLWAGYALFSQNMYQLYSAENSYSYREKIRENIERGSKLNYDILNIFLYTSESYVDRIEGKTTESIRFKGSVLSDKKFEDSVLSHAGNGTANSWYATLIGTSAYLSRNYREAERILDKYKEDVEKSRILFLYSEYRFYKSLLLLKFADLGQKLRFSEKLFLRNSRSLFSRWQKIYPAAFSAYASVLKAEIAELYGKEEEASVYYESAIKEAEYESSDLRKAVVFEHAARWNIRKDRLSYGKFLLQNALRLYGYWGAKSLVDSLKEEFEEVLRASSSGKHSLERVLSDSILATSHNLDLRTVLKASQSISGVIELGELLRQLVRMIMESAAATRGFLVLPDGRELYLRAGSDIEEQGFLPKPMTLDEAGHLLPTEVVYYCFRSGQRILLADASKDPLYSVNPYVRRSKPKSLLCMPITKQGRILCVLYLENRLTSGIFDQHRLEILEILSAQAAISLENAKLYEDITSMNSELEQKVAERTDELARSLEIIRKDMLYSKRIQRSILPEHFTIPGLRYSVNYLPMDEVGGDFYDLSVVKDGKYRFFLADATGHGVQAALITMAIKGEYENLKFKFDDPGEVLSELNNAILTKYKTLYFTATLTDLDLNEMKLKYASAGHLSQYLLRDGETKDLPKTGAILGFVKDYPYKNSEFNIQSGDRLYLFSDGIFEQFDSDKIEYGEERFLNSVLSTVQFDPDRQAEKIIAGVYEFLRETPVQDDITLIILNIE
ncbi:SpoIIE-like protein phosphatase domain protein [Leptospira fainei serovar Hurstbridge str. BUT 6]|uniref:SpoIIE-like protein phosphatase domain protein n=1 Tax=Leptospira fainei serovar Hurstbridge str. BUT 6 TaxID=1193011 RepID=S3UWC5_9LEPT|nr:trifunctional serine/threonine-protein kinase/ATP-binding protein/SpoIIE family protein phosphatase [Leptospira fainei]EPG72654.1 SpoIIE-like protein phosphatase domain protein [Leptospira fainei serovar Hurstbridge str. BUT 6]